MKGPTLGWLANPARTARDQQRMNSKAKVGTRLNRGKGLKNPCLMYHIKPSTTTSAIRKWIVAPVRRERAGPAGA